MGTFAVFMESVLRHIKRLLTCFWSVLEKNATFFFFMYALGIIVSYATLPDKKGAEIYDNLYLELFLDLYILCLVMRALPDKIRWWVRGILYFFLYGLAIVDVYCFVKFDSTLTPTMLMLVGETNSQEAGEFLQNLVTLDVLFSSLGWIILLLCLHVIWNVVMINRKRRSKAAGSCGDTGNSGYSGSSGYAGHSGMIRPVLGFITISLFVVSSITSFHNKKEFHDIMNAPSIGEVERKLNAGDKVVLYQPFYRAVFSIYANHLTAKQIQVLIDSSENVKVDSCSFTSPNIVLIIGESYNRHHSAQYGYWQPTTPRQIALENSGLLTKYTDVVCPWNLTSFVFKFMFSTYCVGDEGDWYNYPLFTELFRAAGYHVTFITNQFLPKAKEAVYDFSGGFFLNNPKLSAAQFDVRNSRVYPHDDSLLVEYDNLKKFETSHNLTIFHLYGQHVGYKYRYPAEQKHFKADDYKDMKSYLNDHERGILADYDNAVLYNDSIVDQIVKRFADRDAVVIYVPDHGEECYEDGMHFFCRIHTARVNARIARQEFEIPFWVYCSRKYIAAHPQIHDEIAGARNRRLMTDALPHMLLYLAGIHSKDYREDCNILSPSYNENRPRILKKDVDYDKLK